MLLYWEGKLWHREKTQKIKPNKVVNALQLRDKLEKGYERM